MHRFFLHQDLTQTLALSDEGIISQIVRVFRAKKGDLFCFFGNQTDDHLYEVTDISSKSVHFELKEVQKNTTASNTTITLFQAYPHKMDTLELIVQKIVEIGVQELVIFRAQRSQTSEISDNKKNRLQKIATEALEQCGGNRPLKITFYGGSIDAIYENYPDLSHVIGDPEGSKEIQFKKSQKIGLWVGPEGGWSPEEKSLFDKKNIHRWKFGNQILRLETAAIVGTGLLAYLSAKV